MVLQQRLELNSVWDSHPNYLLYYPETNYLASLGSCIWNEVDSSENLWSNEKWKKPMECVRGKHERLNPSKTQNYLPYSQIIKKG